MKDTAKDKEAHFIMRKVSIHQEDIILNIYAADNRDLKYMKQNLIELQKQIDTMKVRFQHLFLNDLWKQLDRKSVWIWKTWTVLSINLT